LEDKEHHTLFQPLVWSKRPKWPKYNTISSLQFQGSVGPPAYTGWRHRSSSERESRVAVDAHGISALTWQFVEGGPVMKFEMLGFSMDF